MRAFSVHTSQKPRGWATAAVLLLSVAATDAFADERVRLRAGPERIAWRQLQEGLAYAEIRIVDRPTHGDGLLHVVKIDPMRAPIRAFGANIDGVEPQTAADWARHQELAVVINAGMFEQDHRTHTGYFRVEETTNSDKWVSAYKSVLVVPRQVVHAPARIIDLDVDEKPDFDRFDVVVQNLRLIKAPGVNVWRENHRHWSEAAIAMTKTGELLFIFCRTPMSMREFNAKLLAAGLDVVRAMHVEGGPEASLSIHAAGIDLDLSGSYETGFVENDDNRRQWLLPNVLGVARKVGR